VLVEALLVGATRGSLGTPEASGGVPTKGVPTKNDTISGAAFNCGRECTITHKGQTLTIDNAQLADYPGRDKSLRTPAVTLHLDGRQDAVVDSFNPHLKISVTAKWQGHQLQIDSLRDPLAATQLISLDGTQLVVVSARFLNGERRYEMTFKYKKK